MKKILFILITLLSVNINCTAQMQQFWLLNTDTYIPSDPDALTYITNVEALAGFVSNPTRIAIDTLVKKLKRKNFWNTFAYAYYPFPVKNASGNSLNLLNPLNTDAAFRLSFVGSPTFDYQGVHWNGTTQYANTHFNPNTFITLSNSSFGIYSESNITTGTSAMGAFDDPNSLFQIHISLANGVLGNLNSATYTPVNTNGLIMCSRTSATSLTAYVNTTAVATNTTNTTLNINADVFLGARNRRSTGIPDIYSVHTTAFAFIARGMNSTQQSDFYAIIQDYETRMNRAL